jgi:hypothetical protein
MSGGTRATRAKANTWLRDRTAQPAATATATAAAAATAVVAEAPVTAADTDLEQPQERMSQAEMKKMSRKVLMEHLVDAQEASASLVHAAKLAVEDRNAARQPQPQQQLQPQPQQQLQPQPQQAGAAQPGEGAAQPLQLAARAEPPGPFVPTQQMWQQMQDAVEETQFRAARQDSEAEASKRRRVGGAGAIVVDDTPARGSSAALATMEGMAREMEVSQAKSRAIATAQFSMPSAGMEMRYGAQTSEFVLMNGGFARARQLVGMTKGTPAGPVAEAMFQDMAAAVRLQGNSLTGMRSAAGLPGAEKYACVDYYIQGTTPDATTGRRARRACRGSAATEQQVRGQRV